MSEPSTRMLVSNTDTVTSRSNVAAPFLRARGGQSAVRAGTGTRGVGLLTRRAS